MALSIIYVFGNTPPFRRFPLKFKFVPLIYETIVNIKDAEWFIYSRMLLYLSISSVLPLDGVRRGLAAENAALLNGSRLRPPPPRENPPPPLGLPGLEPTPTSRGEYILYIHFLPSGWFR